MSYRSENEFLFIMRTLLIRCTGTKAVAKEGNEVNNFYLGLYGMLTGLAAIGLGGSVWYLLLKMMPRSCAILHERLLNTVMRAPLSFFTSTDTGTTTNRLVYRS